MQKRNYYKSILEFISDESFQKWVRGDIDSKNWDEWTVENTERAKLVEEARQWIIAMKVEESQISKQETRQALYDTLRKIKKNKPKGIHIKLNSLKFYKATAAVLLGGLIAIYTYSRISNDNSRIQAQVEAGNFKLSGMIEQTNNTDKPQLITLSDASSILLQPRSKLSYPKTFTGQIRKVQLSGEAFFEISKDSKKPFLVIANETVTKVYGTSFRIVAYSDQPNVEVLVRTGKVKVSAASSINSKNLNEVILYPNQAARFQRKGQFFEKILDITHFESFNESSISIEQLSFEFRDVPISQIFTTLEQAYLVNIDFPVEKLKDCYLTTSLIDEPLPEKLKIICESLGKNTRYEMNGNQIKIISNGCN